MLCRSQELSSSSLGSVVVGAVGKARRKKVVQASKTHQFHPFQYCRIYVRLNPYEAYFLQVLVTTAVLCRTTRLGIEMEFENETGEGRILNTPYTSLKGTI